MRSTKQLQRPCPPTVQVAQTHRDDGNLLKTKAPSQPQVGDTGRSSSEVLANRSTSYLPVGRAWGSTNRGDNRSSAARYSPISSWERGVVRDEPWNGVGEVTANESKGSGRQSQSENSKSEKDSNCATKGSSEKTG